MVGFDKHSYTNGSDHFFVFVFRSWLDEAHPNTIFYYHKVVLLMGVFLALYNTIRQVNEINKSDSN